MQPWNTVIAAAAGVYGAVGVGLAAWSAHRSGGELLMTAALFLLLHAAPMLAIALATNARALLGGATMLGLGAFLFSGDLALRLLASLKPWAMAAPTGGVLLMLGWLWIAAAALLAARSNQQSYEQ